MCISLMRHNKKKTQKRVTRNLNTTTKHVPATENETPGECNGTIKLRVKHKHTVCILSY